MQEEITLDDYVLTNINLNNLHYIIKLKDGNVYDIYKQGQKDYIIKDNKRIYLSKEVRDIVISEIREYERYGV